MDIQKDDRKACGKEQTGDRDWKVTFEGGFYGQRGRRGIEIPVGKTFSWGRRSGMFRRCTSAERGWWQIFLRRSTRNG